MIASPDSSRAGELVDGALGDLARRDHDPGRARLVELGDEVVERLGAGRALAGERGDGVRVDVEDDALVAVAHQPADEVGAHPSRVRPCRAAWRRILSARPRLATRLRADADRGRHPRDLRDHRRPGAEDDLRGALPARAPRRAQLPDHRRRAQQVGPRRARRHARASRSRPRSPTPTRRRSSGSTSGSTTSRASSTSDEPLQAARRGDGRVRAGRLLPRDPAVAVRRGGQAPARRRADRGRAGRAREAVRPRPRVGAGAQRGAPRGPRRVADPAHRPLPRQGAGDGHPLPALRERDPRAGLEPPVRRLGADHDGRGLRGRGPRQLLRPGRRAARRGPEPPAADARAGRDGAAVGRHRRHRRDPRPQAPTSSGRCPRPTRAATSAASTAATARSTASRSDSDTETFVALRLEIDNWRWSGRPVLHPRRQGDAGRGDRGPGRVQAPAAARDRRADDPRPRRADHPGEARARAPRSA